jgi:acyl carrier protein
MPNLYGDLARIVREVLMRDDIEIGPTTTAADVVGWDSLKHVEIILQVEEKYGIDMPLAEVSRARTVGDLVNLIERRIAAQQGTRDR